MYEYKVSVIVVNWNGEGFLADCFGALDAQSMKDFEVIFVDNGSSDGSVAAAHSLMREYSLSGKVIDLDSNTGFTGGNIEGLRHASGKHIALLNSDTIASPAWLESLVDAMEADPGVGICASKLIVAGTDIIDSAGDGFSSFGRAFKRGEGLPSSAYLRQEYIFGACGGAVLLTRNMIDEVGFLDEDFFIYFEDVDLSFRSQLAGFKCLFVPQAVVEHKVGGSSRKVPHIAAFYSVRNDKILKVKNIPLGIAARYFHFFLLNELISLAYHIRVGRLISYIKGNLAFIALLPDCLRKRAHIMRGKKVSNSYLRGLLTSGFTVYSERHIHKGGGNSLF